MNTLLIWHTGEIWIPHSSQMEGQQGRCCPPCPQPGQETSWLPLSGFFFWQCRDLFLSSLGTKCLAQSVTFFCSPPLVSFFWVILLLVHSVCTCTVTIVCIWLIWLYYLGYFQKVVRRDVMWCVSVDFLELCGPLVRLPYIDRLSWAPLSFLPLNEVS